MGGSVDVILGTGNSGRYSVCVGKTYLQCTMVSSSDPVTRTDRAIFAGWPQMIVPQLSCRTLYYTRHRGKVFVRDRVTSIALLQLS